MTDAPVTKGAEPTAADPAKRHGADEKVTPANSVHVVPLADEHPEMEELAVERGERPRLRSLPLGRRARLRAQAEGGDQPEWLVNVTADADAMNAEAMAPVPDEPVEAEADADADAEDEE